MIGIVIASILIALLLACALRIVCRGTAVSSSSPPAGADDPHLFPFGEMPVVPRDRITPPLFHAERVKPVFGRAVRRQEPCDFRAWGIPDQFDSAAVAHRRNESGGRPASLSGTAVVLTFPRRGA